jgi:hypothetical protein
MTKCLVVAEIGDDLYPCQSHEGGIPAHHFAMHWPPCEAPWCKLPPGHRELHDIPSGEAKILAILAGEADHD